jgi:hypothetical protein
MDFNAGCSSPTQVLLSARAAGGLTWASITGSTGDGHLAFDLGVSSNRVKAVIVRSRGRRMRRFFFGSSQRFFQCNPSADGLQVVRINSSRHGPRFSNDSQHIL